MGGGMLALFWTTILVGSLTLVWMIVPTEQSLGATFSNVLILQGMGTDGVVEPISVDNASVPALSESEAKGLNGLFQFEPLFYHKSMDRFVPWEEQGSVRITVFSCTLFCSPVNTSATEARLALVHKTSDQGKKNTWYLLEFRDDDANSPYIYARTKYRKYPTYRVPWVTVTPGGDAIKPKDLPSVNIVSAWDLFRFDTPLKWGVTVVLVVGTGLWIKFKVDDDD